MPAMTTPIPIARNAFLQSMPSSHAKTVPVYAPVTGKGIATNKVNPQKPYFSIFGLPIFLTLSRYLSNNGIRDRTLSYKKRKAKKMGKNIKALAIIAIKKVNKGSSPKDMPRGIPPLNSLMGKTVINRVKAISFAIMCFKNSAAHNWES